MSTHLKAFTLFAIIIVSIGGGYAFAQTDDLDLSGIVVTTDKESYNDGDTVVISGQVRDLLSGTPVSLQVFAANGNLVTIEQIDISPDKTFSTEIFAGGGLWKSKGTYTVKVLYGTQSRTAETTFEFGGSDGTTPKPTGTIGVDRTNFVLSYTIKGGSVLSVTPDDEANSLIIAIKTTSDGELKITLPRALIDAKINGQDDNFFVLIDGEEVEFEETATGTDRTLTIAFQDGAEEIEIIAAVLATSTSAVFAQGYYDEEACPDCPDPASEMKREQAAQLDIPIRVWTDKAVYDHKSTITVEGSVANVRLGTEIGLTVIGPSPFNNIVAVDQLKIGSDGKYKTTLSTAGDSWKYDGTYTIKVTYGSQQINNKALVQLTGASVIGVKCAPGELTARVSAENYCIPYSISGATVTGARINPATTSMTININTSSDGMLTLEIPRNVLDTKSSTDPLFVLVDGEEVDSEESVTATTRTVTIMFPNGAEEIEIIGTFAIPEFGAIAALILAVAIISIIAVSSKTRLNVLPKY